MILSMTAFASHKLMMAMADGFIDSPCRKDISGQVPRVKPESNFWHKNRNVLKSYPTVWIVTKRVC